MLEILAVGGDGFQDDGIRSSDDNSGDGGNRSFGGSSDSCYSRGRDGDGSQGGGASGNSSRCDGEYGVHSIMAVLMVG